MKGRYVLECPICGRVSDSYEQHYSHVVESHPESLRARFTPRVRRVEGRT